MIPWEVAAKYTDAPIQKEALLRNETDSSYNFPFG